MRNFYNKVLNSEIGLLGRFAIVLVATAVLFVFSHYVCYPAWMNKDVILVFQLVGGAIAAVFLFGFVLIVWAILAAIISVFHWAFYGSYQIFYYDLFCLPAEVFCFLIKLIFGSWRQDD